MRQIAAFFDMDQTLLRCNSGALWMAHERANGRLSGFEYLRALSWLARYKLSMLDMEAVSEKALRSMVGVDEQRFTRDSDQFTHELMLPHVSPIGLEALEKHRAAGHTLALLTSATRYVAAPVGKYLAIPHVLCTELEIDDGRFTGKHIRPVCYGAGKVHWAERFAVEHDIDFSRSYFYTDSYSDLPMLERVGEPRVVNPDTRLQRHAKRVGWATAIW